ncbi:hypothetical protein Bca4012_037223 [Brassica carinata]
MREKKKKQPIYSKVRGTFLQGTCKQPHTRSGWRSVDSGETVPAPPSLLSVEETKPRVDCMSLRALSLSFKLFGFVFG